jgi:hypothetical protein
MQSTLYPPTVAHAVRWHRAASAIAILICGLLFVFATASTAHAATTGGAAAPTTISISHSTAHAADASTTAGSLSRAEHVQRSSPLRPVSLHGVDDACPFEPDVWFDDDRDDDDDDESDRHGAHARGSATTVEDALGRRCPSRALGGSAVPDGSLPINLSLSESVRRM